MRQDSTTFKEQFFNVEGLEALVSAVRLEQCKLCNELCHSADLCVWSCLFALHVPEEWDRTVLPVVHLWTALERFCPSFLWQHCWALPVQLGRTSTHGNQIDLRNSTRQTWCPENLVPHSIQWFISIVRINLAQFHKPSPSHYLFMRHTIPKW